MLAHQTTRRVVEDGILHSQLRAGDLPGDSENPDMAFLGASYTPVATACASTGACAPRMISCPSARRCAAPASMCAKVTA